MAKRKKLNKRIVGLLVAMGIIVLIGAVYLGLKRLPADENSLRKVAEAAVEAGDLDLASERYSKLISATESRPEEQAEYWYKLGQVQWEYRNNASLAETERNEHVSKAISCLSKALTQNKSLNQAQSLLCDIYWEKNAQPELFIAQATNLINMDPENHLAYFRRAEKHGQLAQTVPGPSIQAAISDYRKAIQLKGDEALYWVRLAYFLAETKIANRQQQDEPEYVFKEALAANKASSEIYIAYSNWCRQNGNTPAAKELIQQAVKNAPDDLRSHLAMALQQLTENDKDGAFKSLEEAKRLDPSDPSAYRLQAEIHLSQKNLTEASASVREGIKVLGSMAATQPAGRDASVRLLSARLELNSLLANILLNEMTASTQNVDQLREEVVLLLDQIIQLQPESPLRYKISGRLALSHVAKDPAKLIDAIKDFEEADKRFRQRDQQTINLLFASYVTAGRPGDAEALINRLLSAPGREADPNLLVIKAKLERGYRNYDNAKKYLRAALKSDPNNSEAKDMLKVMETITSNDLVIPKDVNVTPQNLQLFMEQAAKAWDSGDRNGAIKLMEDIHKQLPDQQDVALQLVNSYAATGQDERARNLLDKLIASAKDANAEKQLRQAREMIGEKDPAKRYQKSIQLAEQQGDPLQKALAKAELAASFNAQQDYLLFLEEAAKINPDSPVVISRKFEVALRTRQWDEAQKWIDLAVKNDVDSGKGLLFKARLAMERQQFAEAVKMLEELHKSHPHSRQVQNILADAYRLNRQMDKAEEQYQAMYKSDPGYFPAVLGLALVTEQQPDKWDKHREYINRAYMINPNHPHVAEQYLLNQEATSKPEEIIAQRKRMLQQKPDDVNNMYRLALLYERTGQRNAAEELFTRAFQLAQDKIAAARLLAAFYLRQNRFADIDSMVQKMLADGVDRVGVYIMYGDFLTTRDQDQSKASYQKALQANPKDPRPYLSLANFHGSRNEWKLAIENLDNYIKTNPSGTGAGEQKLMISMLLNDRQFEPASQRIDALLARNNADFEVLSLRARMLLLQEQPAKAMEVLNSAVTLNASSPEPLLNRAQFNLEQNELNKAREDLEAAKAMTPNPEVALRLAAVYRRQYEMDKASETLLAILAQNRDYRPAIQELVSMYLQQKKFRELETLLGDYTRNAPENPQILIIKSKIWEGLKDSAKRIACLEDAVRLAPDSPEIFRIYMMGLADEKQNQQVLTKSEGLDQKPGYDWVKAVRARAMVGLGRGEEGDKIFADLLGNAQGNLLDFAMDQLMRTYKDKELISRMQKWTQNRSEDPKVAFYVGSMAISSNDLTLAEEIFVKTLAKVQKPEEKVQFTMLLAATYYQRHISDRSEKEYLAKAEQLFLEGLKSAPRDIRALNNLAYLYADDLNDPAKAYPYAELAAKIQPDSNVLDTLGWTIARLGDKDPNQVERRNRLAQAEQVLLRSMQLEQSTANRYHLGWVYEITGRPGDALKLYSQSFENVRDKQTDPLYSAIKEAMERVKKIQGVK